MNQIVSIILLTLMQFIAGAGMITLIRCRIRPGIFLPVSVLFGLGLFSLVPFLLQLLFIPITRTAVFLGLLLFTLLPYVQFSRQYRDIKEVFISLRFRIRLYEIPFIALTLFILFVSIWRCYYFPPVPRDLTSGPEVIAEYTIREKTMINSVFTVDLETTNNQYKPAYLTSLQVIYKYAGFPFGQVWLSVIFAFFTLFLYQAMNMYIHRLLSGFLLIAFLVIPEMYAYTFMALFDYSNAVYFCLSVFFLVSFFRSTNNTDLALSGLLMALATYTRSETLALAVFLSFALVWHHIKNWHSLKKMGTSLFLFLVPALVCYLLTVTLYLNLYLPVPYQVSGLINPHPFNLEPLITRFWDMNTKLIFGSQGWSYYGYFFFLFMIIFLFDFVLSDRWQTEPRNWSYAVLVIYLGLPFLGFLLPLMDLDNSTKRGLFKIFPLMLLYMASSNLLRDLSERINRWENSLGKQEEIKEEIIN